MNYDRIVKVVRVLLIGVVGGLLAVVLVVARTYKHETLVQMGLLSLFEPRHPRSLSNTDYSAYTNELPTPKVIVAPPSMRNSRTNHFDDSTNLPFTLTNR
jgi:hypothetical protein